MRGETRAFLIAGAFGLFMALAGAWIILTAADDDTPAKVAVARPAGSPAEVYVLQSFYDDLTFVDGVFSSVAKAEKWIEGAHGSFEKATSGDVTTYEAGDFTYLITIYEVDDRG